MRKVLLGVVACCCAWVTVDVAAQAAPQAVRMQAAAAQPDMDPGSMATAARQVLELIDANRAAEVWEGSSNVAKRSITRDAFVQQAMAARASLGRAVSRTWLSVLRQQVDANAAQQPGNPPQGMYISVRFATTFANGRSAIELVTFRMDEDATWRLAGYTTQ